MKTYEYLTLIYGTADRHGRRWVITAKDARTLSRQVGRAEPGRFVGRIWQAMRLLETALEELDADGWELVATSFSGLFNFYGTTVLRRKVPAQSPS